jgi:hypothetical protein
MLTHTCRTQCDWCHTATHCTEATRRWREMLLCADCYGTIEAP